MALTHLFDQLLPSSVGCKYPDGEGNATIALQNRGLYTLASGAAGNTFEVFSAGYPYNGLGVGSFSSPTYTMTGTSSSLFSQALLNTLITSGGSAYRPVCGGMIFRSMQSAMNASGTLILSKLPYGLPESGTWTSGTLLGDTKTFPITAGMSVSVLFTPMGTTAFEFVSANTTTTYSSGVAWDSIGVEITGATASANILECEYIVNHEVSVSSTEYGYQLLATKSKSNPRAIEITRAATAALPSTIIKGDGEQVQDIMTTVASGLSKVALKGLETAAMSMM
jgi:hypothetical protein